MFQNSVSLGKLDCIYHTPTAWHSCTAPTQLFRLVKGVCLAPPGKIRAGIQCSSSAQGLLSSWDLLSKTTSDRNLKTREKGSTHLFLEKNNIRRLKYLFQQVTICALGIHGAGIEPH